MTKPTITNEEVLLFRQFINAHPHYTVAERECFKEALADFLARRVPEVRPPWNLGDPMNPSWCVGFNACRDIVLAGRADEGPK